MCFASRSAPSSSTPDLPTRSDPARSTRLSFPRRTVSAPGSRRSTTIVNTQCDRLDCRFIGVSATARFTSPRKSKFSASSSEPARCAERPRAWITPSSSSNRATFGKKEDESFLGCVWTRVLSTSASSFGVSPRRSSPDPPPPFAPSKSKSYAWSLYTSTYDTVTSYVAPSFARRAISENSFVTALGTMPLST